MEAIGLEEAAKLSNAKRNSNRSRVNQQRKRINKEGGNLTIPCLFSAADGSFAVLDVKVDTARALQLPEFTDAVALRVSEIKAKITLIKNTKTKKFQYSLASKLKKRTKAGRQVEKYERIWIDLNIPVTFTVIDTLFFVKTWGQKPEMIRIDGQRIITGIIKNLALKRRAKPKPLLNN